AAQPCFQIEIRARAHVLGNIGDVYLEFVAVDQFGDQHGVVEVAGGFAVNGNDGQLAEVAAARDLLWVEMRHGTRLGQHAFGKDARQLVFSDHHLDVHAEVVRGAEHFDDAADRGTGGGGPTGDFDIHDQAFKIGVWSGGSGLAAQHAMRRS